LTTSLFYAKIVSEIKTNMDFLKEKARALFGLAGEVAVAFFVVIIVAFLLSYLETTLSNPTAHAASVSAYEAMPVTISGSGELVMRPGERRTVSATFQNIGTKTWDNDGAGYVSVYTYSPKYRRSDFDPGTWLAPDQVKRVVETSVPVGSVGSFVFELHAPIIEGSYSETFKLASEDTAWVSGGEFTFQITVEEEPPAPVLATQSDQEQGSDELVFYSGYHATLENELNTIQAQPGSPVETTISLVNTGSTSWHKRRVQLPDIMLASTSGDYFHSSWLTRNILTARSSDLVEPGQADDLSIRFTAPETEGDHTVRFQYIVDENTVVGGEIDIPVEVTADAPDVLDQPIVVATIEQIEEPVVRVGIMTVDEETDDMIQISSEVAMSVQDEHGAPLANVNANQIVTVYYSDDRYYFDVGRGLEKSTYPIRFIPEEENAILTIENFDRRATRNAAHADNTFRNILEIRYSDVKGNIWMINELSMETYLKGLAETSNISHIEYQKALILAARTYAFYHWQRGTKHDAEGYHVDAYADQVYKGQGQESRMPKLTQAIEETRGQIVTYDGETAITPYFSRSDGRTRDWSEVWYGSVEWLKSVSVPHDQGRTLWGHGVGMSASGALGMANDGQTYDEIIKYFYQGIDLTQKWE
jgi:hypothetical protein